MVLHGNTVLPYQALQSFCESQGVRSDSADISTDAAANAGGDSSTYSKALVLCSSNADPAILGAVAKRLTPGSTVAVQLHKEQVRVCAWERRGLVSPTIQLQYLPAAAAAVTTG